MRYLFILFFGLIGMAITNFTGGPSSTVIEVNRPLSTVYNAAANNSGSFNMFGYDSGIAQKISISKNQDASVTYHIRSELGEGDAVITMKFAANAKGGTDIELETDVPEVKINLGKDFQPAGYNASNMYISEKKVSRKLTKSVRELAATLNRQQSSTGKMDDFNVTLQLVALVLNPSIQKNALASAREKIEQSFSDMENYGGDTDYGNSGDGAIDGKPSMDLEPSNEDSGYGASTVEPEFGDPDYNG